MRFSYMRSATLSALAPFILLACGASSTDASSDVGDPGAAEQEVASGNLAAPKTSTFMVVAPPSAPSNARVFIGGTYNKLGVEIGPLETTGHWWDLVSYPLKTDTIQTLPPGLTTVQAGVFSVDIKNVPQPTLGISKTDTLTPYVNVYRIVNGVSKKINRDYLPLTSDGTETMAVLPGTYKIAYGYSEADGPIFDIAGGETKRIQAWDYAARRVAKVVAPPVRKFETVPCALVYAGATVQHYFLYYGRTHRMILPDGTSSAEFGVPAGSSYEYRLSMEGIYLTDDGALLEVPVPLGERGQGALPFRIGRVDVDDVAVPQSDGSTKMVRGTYQVFRKYGVDSGGRDLFSTANAACKRDSTFSTRTGVDLPPGRYKLVVSYRAADGTQKQNVSVVDL
ncbi:hypothetical protein [Pendulispora albinea]|uniref:Uncharacterized protein n=1 Tax=Pendulispora albinea TaxID=2741071 RepID=A0ABZ2M1C9_9BACT